MKNRLFERLLRYFELMPYTKIPNHDSDLITFVSATDETHYRTAVNMIQSIMEHEPDSNIIIYDLGLKCSQLDELQNRFHSIVLEKFEYDLYPAYFNVRKKAGEYAWKPIIIKSVLSKTNNFVCWMDAGNRIIEPLTTVRKILIKKGFYSPASSGNINTWTHPKTLKYLQATPEILNRYNLNGAFIALNPNFDQVVKLVNDWANCALDKDCIAPAGSNRSNHRQDQACLSVLAHKLNITKGLPKNYYGFITHQDDQ